MLWHGHHRDLIVASLSRERWEAESHGAEVVRKRGVKGFDIRSIYVYIYMYICIYVYMYICIRVYNTDDNNSP